MADFPHPGLSYLLCCAFTKKKKRPNSRCRLFQVKSLAGFTRCMGCPSRGTKTTTAGGRTPPGVQKLMESLDHSRFARSSAMLRGRGCWLQESHVSYDPRSRQSHSGGAARLPSHLTTECQSLETRRISSTELLQHRCRPIGRTRKMPHRLAQCA